MYRKLFLNYPFLCGLVKGSVVLQKSTKWHYNVVHVQLWENDFEITVQLGRDGDSGTIDKSIVSGWEHVSPPISTKTFVGPYVNTLILCTMTGETEAVCTHLPIYHVTPQIALHHNAGGALAYTNGEIVILQDGHEAALAALDGTLVQTRCEHV